MFNKTLIELNAQHLLSRVGLGWDLGSHKYIRTSLNADTEVTYPRKQTETARQSQTNAVKLGFERCWAQWAWLGLCVPSHLKPLNWDSPNRAPFAPKRPKPHGAVCVCVCLLWLARSGACLRGCYRQLLRS